MEATQRSRNGASRQKSNTLQEADQAICATGVYNNELHFS